ncbi:MAG: hypothetical protein GY711_29000 [bacterium]|nr:hypothetical protein [bacterium]
MPSSIKLAREYGDDLGLLFVECQGATQDKQEAFAWKQKWMGTQAMWTTERPFNTGSKGLPNFALLSSEGEVLMMGNPLSMHKKIEEAIEAEIAKARKAPSDSPKSLKSAWKAFGKGDFGKAVTAARKIAGKGGDDVEAANAAIATIEARAATKLDQVDRMIETGFVLEAKGAMKGLVKSMSGLEAAERAASIAERLGSDQLKKEMDAAKALTKLEKALNEDGFEPKIVKQLEKFAGKHSGTKAASRAQHLAKLADSV